MIKNLITGGCGFIGSHLCEKLISRGEKVVCLDNLDSGNKENIQHLINNKNFELIEHDVTQPFQIEVNRIWHLACPASPIHYQKNPIKTAKTCFLGTYHMLGLAKRIQAKLLFASSSEIYGNPDEHPQKETYNGSVKTTTKRSCYVEGKRAAESLCYAYQEIHDVDIRISRIFNTYGPNMRFDDGRVISNFIVQALKNKRITIYGDGKQTRSFCHIDDLVEGLILLMDSNYQKPINLGNPQECTILELANLIKNAINPELEFEYKILPNDEPIRRKPSIELARELLNWEPKIRLSEGISNTIEWFKE
jgi:UDP-glucuronate decarboxylase